jgi:hypothetical protein
MSGRPDRLILAVALAAGTALAGPARAEPLALACSADRPSVGPDEEVTVRAWAVSPDGHPLTYAWAATAGRIEARGAEARWTLAGLRPGAYAATVTVREGGGAPVECLLRVVVRRDAAARGPVRPPPGIGATPGARETGRSLLLPGRSEEGGYGLYSYLLLGAPPSEAARERYQRTMDAFVGLIPDIAGLEEYVERRELNIAYLPVRMAPAQALSGAWALDNYDYARARVVLRNLPGSNRDGPYLVAALRPLLGARPAEAGPYLLQDLSAVPPHLAASWVKEFLNQAAQERFWEERTGVRLAQRLRVTIGVLSTGLPEVKKALDTWITWVR